MTLWPVPGRKVSPGRGRASRSAPPMIASYGERDIIMPRRLDRIEVRTGPKRGITIKLRVTPGEQIDIARHADGRGVTTSRFIREAALGRSEEADAAKIVRALAPLVVDMRIIVRRLFAGKKNLETEALAAIKAVNAILDPARAKIFIE